MPVQTAAPLFNCFYSQDYKTRFSCIWGKCSEGRGWERGIGGRRVAIPGQFENNCGCTNGGNRKSGLSFPTSREVESQEDGRGDSTRRGKEAYLPGKKYTLPNVRTHYSKLVTAPPISQQRMLHLFALAVPHSLKVLEPHFLFKEYLISFKTLPNTF